MRDLLGLIARPIPRTPARGRRALGRHERFLLQLADLGRVLAKLPSVELGRRALGPIPLLSKLRAHGRAAPRRTPPETRSLERAIAWADAVCPGGRNCYRRALLAMCLDPDAAEKPLVIGLRAEGRRTSGHAWIGGGDEPMERFDVRFEVPSSTDGAPPRITG